MTHRVLLTGAGGFVGSQLVRLLLAEGHSVTAVIDPSTDRWRLHETEKELSVIESDLRDLTVIRDRLRGVRPSICVHLAWRGWSGQAPPDENLSSLAMSLELLKLMPVVGCNRFVATGTCFEYDLGYERLAETTPLHPGTLYGACKKSLFEIAQKFASLNGLSVLTPRLFYSYGPGEDPRRMVPAIALCLLRGETARVTPGHQIRDYLHVEDVASAIWAAATSALTGAVNIASGEAVTVAQIATTIGELLDRSELVALGAMEYREGDPMRVLADATLLRCGIGWSPRFGLKEGLDHTLTWWKARVTSP